MPLLNSMGVLRNMTATTSTTVANQHYMYMYAPGAVSSFLSQNDTAISAYDSSQGKLVSVNAQNDQILAVTDSSNIVFDAVNGGIYTPWMAAGNNKVWFYQTDKFLVSDMASYSRTDMGGTLSQLGTELTKVCLDSTGATIRVGTEVISSVYYIVVTKFTTAGIVWQKKISHPTGLTTSYFQPACVCVDSSDNIYFSGQLSTTGVLVRVTSAGTVTYSYSYSNLQIRGLVVVGTTLYASMMTSSVGYYNYNWETKLPTAIPYVAAITAATGSMTKLTWYNYLSGSNPYVPYGISADPSDPSSIFVYGYRQDMSVGSIPDAKIYILRFNAALTSLTSQRQISFTPNLVANPTYTNNVTFINNLVYQPGSNSYYITGVTQDMHLDYRAGSYYNSFIIRATVDANYTGTILNRTYNFSSLGDSIALNNASTLTPTSFGTVTNTAYTVSPTTGSIGASASVPTKVLL